VQGLQHQPPQLQDHVEAGPAGLRGIAATDGAFQRIALRRKFREPMFDVPEAPLTGHGRLPRCADPGRKSHPAKFGLFPEVSNRSKTQT